MEACPNCGIKLDGWIDVTGECSVELALTSTKDHLGYILLKHREITIGSFNVPSEFSYYTRSITDEGEYKVLQIIHDKHHPYFLVYYRKKK